MTMKIGDILHGCKPVKIQSVGYMQVIPLISDLEDDRFISPKRAIVSTTTYGSLSFENKEDKDVIVPSQTAYLVKQAAQDHAMTGVGFVPKKKTTVFDNAACIQQSQPGCIPKGEHEMIILPIEIRSDAHSMRTQKSYSKLWPTIASFNKRTGVASHAANMEAFFTTFKDQLDSFVAEFEPVPKQVGAIILINGKLVGIERVPNEEFWLDVWVPLIRECYGSMAISEAKKNDNKKSYIPKTRTKLPKAINISDLRKKLEETEKDEYEKVKTIVANVCDLSVDNIKDGTQGSVVLESVSNETFVGQVISDTNRVVYASIVSKYTSTGAVTEEWFLGKKFQM